MRIRSRAGETSTNKEKLVAILTVVLGFSMINSETDWWLHLLEEDFTPIQLKLNCWHQQQVEILLVPASVARQHWERKASWSEGK